MESSDVDNSSNTLSYTLAGAVPAGATINAATGVFSWTPTEDQRPQSYTFTVVVSDGSLTDQQEVSIKVEEVNQLPVATSTAVTSAKAGEAYAFTFTATDADLPAQTLNYKALELPSWLTFDAATQQLSGTPEEGLQAQSYAVSLQVSDGVEVVVQEFSIQIEVPSGLFDGNLNTAGLKVYPNPTTGRITIELEEGLKMGEPSYSLYDLNGRWLLQQKGSLVQGSNSVSKYLENAKDGIYVLRLQTGDMVCNLRIHKQ